MTKKDFAKIALIGICILATLLVVGFFANLLFKK